MEIIKLSGKSLQLMTGDITTIQADAIVNAANSSLMGGGGVDGAIHLAGGPVILQECRQIVAKQGGCPPGEAVVTSAGNLPAKYVIHSVGPVWHGGNSKEAEILAKCYYNSMIKADEYNCEFVTFPSISTGVYRYPLPQAAEIALNTVIDHLTEMKTLKKVIMVLFNGKIFDVYASSLQIISDKL